MAQIVGDDRGGAYKVSMTSLRKTLALDTRYGILGCSALLKKQKKI